MKGIKIGTQVKWNDIAINDFTGNERELQESRVYEVVKFISEDVVLIADEFGESEVFIDELKIIA